LSENTPEKAIAGIYYALRLIRHRSKILSLTEGLYVQDSQSEPASDERQIALVIIKEIEKTEGLPVLKFSESKAEEYSLLLSKLIEERSKRTYGRNRGKGQELLAQLRAIY